MTIIDAAAQSKTFARAWGDLVDGFRRRELWLHLGWQDIKQRYRRSVLGPFWITIATGTTAVAMGGLYSKLFHLQLSVHLPYVTLGLIIWNLINASILEGADVFVANEGLIKQLPTPLSVHVYRLVWRQMILFAHNIVIYRRHRDHLSQTVVVGRPFGDPGAGADRAQLRVGVVVFRHPGDALSRHRAAAVLRRAIAVLHDADHLERRHPAAAGRGTRGRRSSNSTRCCITWTSCGPRCWVRTKNCGTGRWWSG